MKLIDMHQHDLTLHTTRSTLYPPPPLVGYSSTVINDKLYVFGGRLVHVRRMVSDLWALDLHTLVWSKLWPPTSDEDAAASGPRPRYFHRWVDPC